MLVFYIYNDFIKTLKKLLKKLSLYFIKKADVKILLKYFLDFTFYKI